MSTGTANTIKKIYRAILSGHTEGFSDQIRNIVESLLETTITLFNVSFSNAILPAFIYSSLKFRKFAKQNKKYDDKSFFKCLIGFCFDEQSNSLS